MALLPVLCCAWLAHRVVVVFFFGLVALGTVGAPVSKLNQLRRLPVECGHWLPSPEDTESSCECEWVGQWLVSTRQDLVGGCWSDPLCGCKCDVLDVVVTLDAELLQSQRVWLDNKRPCWFIVVPTTRDPDTDLLALVLQHRPKVIGVWMWSKPQGHVCAEQVGMGSLCHV